MADQDVNRLAFSSEVAHDVPVAASLSAQPQDSDVDLSIVKAAVAKEKAIRDAQFRKMREDTEAPIAGGVDESVKQITAWMKVAGMILKKYTPDENKGDYWGPLTLVCSAMPDAL